MSEKILESKYLQLEQIITEMQQVMVAYSGGVDSTLLLYIANKVLGENCIGVIGISPSVAHHEFQDAMQIAQSINVRVDVIETNEIENPGYVINDRMRCFHCKYELFSMMINYAYEKGIKYILDGNNYDDLTDFRPGRDAAKKLNIRSPFVEATFTKAEIREMARLFDLPNWNKPAQPCLASRMAYGQRIDPKILDKIASAELFLKNNEFEIVRVRYLGTHVSVEVGRHEIDRLFDPARQKVILTRLKSLGFSKVVFDKEGYQSGKMNRNVTIP